MGKIMNNTRKEILVARLRSIAYRVLLLATIPVIGVGCYLLAAGFQHAGKNVIDHEIDLVGMTIATTDIGGVEVLAHDQLLLGGIALILAPLALVGAVVARPSGTITHN